LEGEGAKRGWLANSDDRTKVESAADDLPDFKEALQALSAAKTGLA